MHRGNQFHEVGFRKLETMVLLENNFVLSWRLYTETHETTVAQLLFHVSSPNVVVEWLTLLLCIQEVQSLNLCM
jgi:hypothetical protein